MLVQCIDSNGFQVFATRIFRDIKCTFVSRHTTKDGSCGRCSMDNETVNHILFMCPYARLSGLCLRFMLLQMGKCQIQQINKSVPFDEPETSRSY